MKNQLNSHVVGSLLMTGPRMIAQMRSDTFAKKVHDLVLYCCLMQFDKLKLVSFCMKASFVETDFLQNVKKL